MPRSAAALLLVLAFLGVPVAAHAASAQDAGGVPLHACDLGIGRPTSCGSIPVALDPSDSRAGTIRIGFGWVAADGTAAATAGGTVVAMEGGPGYPSTGTAADFAAMLGPLLRHRNLLVVDARGTGRSTPIDCEPLQSLPSPSPRFQAALTACGRQLNHTFPRAGGGFVHASDLFTTANTARDVAAVIRALRLGRVDLYGDSYGTYFAQSFLSRYPKLLRSVVLDSAYEARALDPWYRTTIATARTAFDEVCAHAVGCPPPAPGSASPNSRRMLRDASGARDGGRHGRRRASGHRRSSRVGQHRERRRLRHRPVPPARRRRPRVPLRPGHDAAAAAVRARRRVRLQRLLRARVLLLGRPVFRGRVQ